MSEKKQAIGAIWKKQVNGKELLSGNIEIEGKTYKLAIWQNDYKKEAKHPDYKVYIDTYEPKPNAANNIASTGQITDTSIVKDDFNLPF